MKITRELPEPVLTTRGEFGDGLAELITAKLAPLARHAHEPVLGIRIEVGRHADPAVARPVAMSATVNLNGRPMHAGATARTARDAIDVVVGRLVRQLDARSHVRRRNRTRIADNVDDD